MFIFGLHSTSDDRLRNLSDERQPKCKKMKKGPLCHQKIKCLFLDYVQLLIIGRVISASNVDRNPKKMKGGPLCHQKKMLGFGLCSTSDNQPSDLSDKRWLKCGKRPPKSSKNEILIFILYSTSHNQTSDLSDESWSKCKKMTCCFS